MSGTAESRRRKVYRTLTESSLFGLIVLSFLLLVFWSRIVITIPAGSIGVLWHQFGGTVLNYHCTEGLRLIFPWDRIFIYDARLRRIDQKISALSGDGLPVGIFTSTSFFIDQATVAELHKAVGPDYERTLLQPLITAQISRMVASRNSDQLYSLSRAEIMGQITNAVQQALSDRSRDGVALSSIIHMINVDVRSIVLPPDLVKAIELKLSEQQQVLRYAFVLQKERLESQRKVIEAEGIRNFQQVVTPSISDSYLRWRGIEATLSLATSANSKVVVIGSGPGGLPIILGGMDDKGASPPAAVPTVPAIATPPAVPIPPAR